MRYWGDSCINVRLRGQWLNEVNSNSYEIRKWLRSIYKRSLPVVLTDSELEELEDRALRMEVPIEIA